MRLELERAELTISQGDDVKYCRSENRSTPIEVDIVGAVLRESGQTEAAVHADYRTPIDQDARRPRSSSREGTPP
jgi:hypothetical protein